jgi:hypothetical protein
LCAELVWIGWRTGRLAGDGAGLRFDPAWAEVIATTVGPWVYLLKLPAAFAVACGWVLVFGALGVIFTGTSALRTAALRMAAGTGAALAIHVLAVDLLNLRFAMPLQPQRASLALAAVALAAVGHWIAASLRDPDPTRRLLGGSFLASAVLLGDPGVAVAFGVLLALAWGSPVAALPVRLRWPLAAALAVGVAVLCWPAVRVSFHLQPARVGAHLARLWALGVDEDWAVVQRHIRDHSQPGDAVMAPPALSPRVFAQRPSTMRMKMQSFTYLSRPYAFAFDAWRREIGIPLQTADAAEALALAGRAEARWLVLDDRDTPVSPGDPGADFRSGPYRAFALPAPAAATRAIPARSGNPTR